VASRPWGFESPLSHQGACSLSSPNPIRSMKTELIDVSPTQKQLVLEIPTEVVATEMERIARDYSKAARIPGFRPGKAPIRIVRQRYQDQIAHDVVHDLIPKALDEALREQAVEPVDTPDIRDVQFGEGQPLVFKASFETVPPLEPIDVSEIQLRRPPVEVSEEAVESMLQRLRERAARFEPVEGRPSRQGDVLMADLTRRPLPAAGVEAAAGEPERHDDITVEIGGAANPPGFDGQIEGLEAGADKTFVITFPEDYAVAELAGTSVEYSITVKGLKEKVLPALDDDLAKDLGDFGSLEQLRDRVRTSLRAEAEHTQEQQVRDDLLRQLASRVPFDPPATLVDREIDRRMEEFVRRLIEQRVDPLRAGVDWNDFRERQRPAAVETVKSMLALDDVARREGIAATSEEVDSEIERVATRSGRPAAEVRSRIDKDGGTGRLYAGIRREKTIRWIESRATILGI
jgi:trigger factor